MSRKKSLKLYRKLHKWPGIIIAFFAVFFATSGIILNHRQTFSSIDISRSLLPSDYRYKNWNLSAVRGSLPLNNDSLLIYGNIGIWKTDNNLEKFEDFNRGFPKGIDGRKINSVIQLNQSLYAGTHFGLFARESNKSESWEKVSLPVKEERIADLNLKNDTLLVLTRHYLLKSTDGKTFETVQLPEPAGYERRIGLFITLWELHSGELWGITGKLIVDLLGIVTIILAITGLNHFFFPKIIKRRRAKKKPVSKIARTFRKNLRWHNVFGYIFAIFLIINTIAGIHLRPPFLIPIANKTVKIIPWTHLDTPNPWFDKLRRVEWDENMERYIFSTSEGFYAVDEAFAEPALPFALQPPVSVMGLNLFKPAGDKKYLTGSFNGLFLWNMQTGRISDFFTGAPFSAPKGMGNPVGANMVTGLVEAGSDAWWFDYNRGFVPLSGKPFPEMPDEIIKKSPLSLWGFALEVHTGRIFEHILGPFYILIVPIVGLCLIMVIVSGFLIWWKAYRKK